MQHFLPIRLASFVRPLMVLINKSLRTLLLASGLLIVFSMQAKAQDPEIIKGWDNLEEAEFLFDVYYQVVKCSSDSDPQLHLWAFNEGGMVDAVGFTLEVTDGDGTAQTYEIEKFSIGLGKSYKADCTNDAYPYLKLDLPADMDVDTMSIEITYNK